MVEDNLNQREEILPSERAKALKMQLEAIKHQGSRTSGQIDPKDAGKRSNEIVACLLYTSIVSAKKAMNTYQEEEEIKVISMGLSLVYIVGGAIADVYKRQLQMEMLETGVKDLK